MAHNIRIHDTALKDIDSAASWIAEKVSAGKASEWIDSLFDTIDTLTEMPERCPLAPENGKWGPEELRQLLFQNYPSQVPYPVPRCERDRSCLASKTRCSKISARRRSPRMR